MFRKPRDDVPDGRVKPDIGRPPSPLAAGPGRGSPNLQATRSLPSKAMSKPTTRSPLSAQARRVGNNSATSRSPAQLRRNKSKAKANGSILSFFQKIPVNGDPSKNDLNGGDSKNDQVQDDTLFVFGRDEETPPEEVQHFTPDDLDGGFDLEKVNENPRPDFGDDSRYNEDRNSTKRQCIEGLRQEELLGQDASTGSPELAKMTLFPAITAFTDSDCSPIEGRPASTNFKTGTFDREAATSALRLQAQVADHVNPFTDASDSDENEEPLQLSNDPVIVKEGEVSGQYSSLHHPTESSGQENGETARPRLMNEETEPDNDGDEFGTMDYDDAEFAEGEELLERQLAEEQRRLEIEENGLAADELDSPFAPNRILQDDPPSGTNEGSKGACPICEASLVGLTHNDAQLHVNHCLDGTPLPTPRVSVKEEGERTSILNPNRFQRSLRPPKPGQANPFVLGSEKGRPLSSSAFSKLMSSHAEDTAWTTAAAAEQAARGKPAFQRTCPFYKILPGFYICVDAFRYGAVEGCAAYFLSHFHSDHYVGLTSTWAHGPIYCSRITANLVRQQLRVDPSFVVDVEFEQKMEVPGTKGVHVTMIPANHCPGSSLFLFEKAIGGAGGTAKVQRLLHCGDFRACPAHVRHPLLRPDLLDGASGKCVGQQKIDVCYLDTTYLNPRYAFPSQDQVISACAEMCVSLRKDFTDETNEWETMKRGQAGGSMTKWIGTEAVSSSIDHVKTMSVSTGPSTANPRGRLLVVVGTYSIGKERICLAIARALDCKIFAPAGKQRICACLEDDELRDRLTTDPYEGQVHMTPLFEIRAETLQDYLDVYKPHFSRVVGFRPSGWNYKPPNSRSVESAAVSTVLHSTNWRSNYSMVDLVPQRGSTRQATCFGVPYSEHSSFRELTIFCCALRIDKIIPTVNVGSVKSRQRMMGWFEKWSAEKKRNGLIRWNDDDW